MDILLSRDTAAAAIFAPAMQIQAGFAFKIVTKKAGVATWGGFIKRTDLAVECFEEKDKTEINGVKVQVKDNITTVLVLNKNGEKKIGKPCGRYITVDVGSFANDADILGSRLNMVAAVLKSVLPENCGNVLVAGLGNSAITADSLGPKASSYVFATRHISAQLRKQMGFENLKTVSAIQTGVLGNTGVESAEIIKGVADIIKPACLIVIDALASGSPERLGTTVQLSDAGISPGSGVGNHRFEISKKTLGIPVIAMGIPTVISAGSVVNGSEDMFVTPREIDRLTQQGAKLLGMAVNVCLQDSLSAAELYALAV
ncbi:MAG: GPR endopeptidase [Clostridiales bacterium]|nr:GPR endopeptidase [Clostridiales bacterium]